MANPHPTATFDANRSGCYHEPPSVVKPEFCGGSSSLRFVYRQGVIAILGYEGRSVLLRELVGGDPPYVCKLIFLDDPSGFGHRVTDGGRVTERVLTSFADFEGAAVTKVAEGFAETARSLSRRVFVLSDRFWIVALDGYTVRTHFGRMLLEWRESVGQNKRKEFRDRDRAASAYHRAIADKREEGYEEQYARSVSLDDTPTAGTKPGKRKSR